MRRDYFTVDFRLESDDGIPAIQIAYDGPPGGLRDRLASTAESTLESSDIDVAFRHRVEDDSGVLSVTDRVTGEFVFEVDASVDRIEALVDVAQRRDGDGQYEVRLTDTDSKSLVYDKQTLLVYDHDGSLLRERSLIPGSVEL